MAEQGFIHRFLNRVRLGPGLVSIISSGCCLTLAPVSTIISYTTHSILTVKEASLTSLTTAAAPSAGEPLQTKQMRIIFFMDGEYLDQHNYQIKTFIFQSHNNTNRPLHSKDFVYLSDIIKLLNNKEMR